jgi:hypothetical protein
MTIGTISNGVILDTVCGGGKGDGWRPLDAEGIV